MTKQTKAPADRTIQDHIAAARRALADVQAAKQDKLAALGADPGSAQLAREVEALEGEERDAKRHLRRMLDAQAATKAAGSKAAVKARVEQAKSRREHIVELGARREALLAALLNDIEALGPRLDEIVTLGQEITSEAAAIGLADTHGILINDVDGRSHGGFALASACIRAGIGGPHSLTTAPWLTISPPLNGQRPTESVAYIHELMDRLLVAIDKRIDSMGKEDAA